MPNLVQIQNKWFCRRHFLPSNCTDFHAMAIFGNGIFFNADLSSRQVLIPQWFVAVFNNSLFLLQQIRQSCVQRIESSGDFGKAHDILCQSFAEIEWNELKRITTTKLDDEGTKCTGLLPRNQSRKCRRLLMRRVEPASKMKSNGREEFCEDLWRFVRMRS